VFEKLGYLKSHSIVFAIVIAV